MFEDEATGKHYGFPLPIILWDKESGLHVFSSSKFNHGHDVAESNGSYYKLGHDEKIYKTDASGTLLGDEHHPENVKPIDLNKEINNNDFISDCCKQFACVRSS